jgi:membrane protease YdiL (CAAX protease family)
MEKKLETKRIWIFLAFAFGIAWAIDLAIYLLGGVSELRIWSPRGFLLLGSMFAPTVGHILTRLLTGEGWSHLYLRPRFKAHWRWWAVAWLGTPLLILLGTGLFFVLLPQYLDTTLSTARQLLDKTAASTGRTLPFGPVVLVLVQIVQGIVVAPLTNGWATFGEEFGWRAYLLHKLMPLGGRRAVLLLGVIWGVWHWPVIAMGYNYGLGYPGAPWLGLLAMTWFTVVVGTYLAWAALKSQSVWPAVIGHASINGLGAIGALVSKGQPSPLLGPVTVGLIGSLPIALLALWLLWRSHALVEHDIDTEPSPAGVLAHRAV